MDMTTENIAIEEKIVTRLVERFNPDKIILFGSRARGEATNISDVDLLVILPFEGSERDLRLSMQMELLDFDTSVDIIVATPETIQKLSNVRGYIFRNALSEGKLIYER